MIRVAAPADLPRVREIRDNAGSDPLSDPAAATEAAFARFLTAGALWVWQAPGEISAGFAAADIERGEVAALLVAPGQEGRGIGRALLAAACDALRAAGHAAATLRAPPGAGAERHYRAAGWTAGGTSCKGQLILRKPL